MLMLRTCVPTGDLSEEGLLLYLGALKTLLPLLPVSESNSRPEVGSDSEDEDDGILPPHMQVTRQERETGRGRLPGERRV